LVGVNVVKEVAGVLQRGIEGCGKCRAILCGR
jgi:hypothetical protein